MRASGIIYHLRAFCVLERKKNTTNLTVGRIHIKLWKKNKSIFSPPQQNE